MISMEQIQHEFQKRGWQLYKMEAVGTLEQLVSRGPAVALEKGGKYAVLPELQNPYDHRAMRKVLEYLTGKGLTPCMRCGNEDILAEAILLQRSRVVVIDGKQPKKFSYRAFYEYMATLPSVKAN